MPLVECERRLRILAAQAWDDEIKWSDISAWADNFTGTAPPCKDEAIHALFALSRFMYFSRRLTKEMLRALYRDHFEAPTMQRIRRNFKGTKDISLLRKQYQDQLSGTRFIGLGNPAESGAHLLYVFRQVNYLSKNYFADLSSVFASSSSRTRNGEIEYKIRDASVNRIVFFDDIVGSGTQARQYLSEELKRIRAGDPNFELSFLALFATTEGLERLNAPELFNGRATCLFELDSSFKAFSVDARYFADSPKWFDATNFQAMARQYGRSLQSRMPVGYKDGQLLLAFAHNTPDNTLPIFWDQGTQMPWHPIFPRFDKKYA
ncbi:MAG: hypothetical protein RR779_09075 [Comamonas sp.]